MPRFKIEDESVYEISLKLTDDGGFEIINGKYSVISVDAEQACSINSKFGLKYLGTIA